MMRRFLHVLGLVLLGTALFAPAELIAQPYCDQAQGTAGFPSDPTCEASVCSYDSYCCSTQWDGICAGEAGTDLNCTGCLAPFCNAGPPYCDQAQGTAGFPSCTTCSNSVCGYDPYCCNTQWDGVCAGEAGSDPNCTGCLAAPPPSCTPGPPYCDQAQGTAGFPSCTDCSNAVCSYDSYCCNSLWDGICAGEAATDLNCTGCLAPPPPPVTGEDCATATALTVAPNLGACGYTTITSGSTQDGPSSCSGFPADDVWRSFVAPSNGNELVFFTVAGSAGDWVMEVWDGCAGTAIACNDDFNAFMPQINLCQFQYTGGATYYVRMWTYGGLINETADICIYETGPCAAPPPNDDCANAVGLTVQPYNTCPAGQVLGTTVDATPSGAGNPGCDPFGTLNDVWYSFTPAGTGNVEIYLSNAGGGTPPFCDEAQGSAGFPSDPVCEASVCGYDPYCCGTMWDGFCASEAATDLNCTSCLGPPGDFGLSIYASYSCVGPAVEVNCSDPALAVTTFMASAGVTYHIRVHSNPGQEGTFNLCLQEGPPPPTNEDCANALPVPVAPNLGACVNTPVVSGATQDGPSPACGFGPDDDVWFSFVAPVNGSKLVLGTTAGSVTDWVMELWDTCPPVGGPYCDDAQGTAGFPSDPVCEASVCSYDSYCCNVNWDGLCASEASTDLNCVGCLAPPGASALMCNDDANGFMPEITLCASQYTPGATYYIRLFTYGAQFGTAGLCVYENGSGAAPANDLCSLENPALNPLSILGGPITFTSSLDCADPDAIIPNPYGANVQGWTWVVFQLTECADITIDYGPTGLGNCIQNGSLNMYGDCGTVFINSQSWSSNPGCPFPGNVVINFINLSPGNYYYPVLWDPTNNATGTYVIDVTAFPPSNPCPTNPTCAGAIAVDCGDLESGNTENQFNSLPPNACPFPVAPSMGGSLWYTYTTPGADTLVTLSTCGLGGPFCDQAQGTAGFPSDPGCEASVCSYDAFCCSTQWDGICAGEAATDPNCTGCLAGGTPFDTRISVFTGTNCTDLCCLAFNDDGPGCPNFTSEMSFVAEAGETYWIVVHGFGFAEGTFDLSVTCSPICTPVTGNDDCATAAVLTPVLADGLGVPTMGDNTCAQSDPNPGCDLFGVVQGVWYTFNTGTKDTFTITLLTNNEDPLYTTTGISYALYDGCNTGVCPLGGANELDCNSFSAAGTNPLPTLTPGADYKILVWNAGGPGLEGTFGILLEYPADNDVMLVDVVTPDGNTCSTQFNPVIEVRNNGLQPLSFFDVFYDIDGGAPMTQTITLGTPLNYFETELVSLNLVSTTPGPHVFNATVDLPNGVPDEIPANNSGSSNFDVNGEAARLIITTDTYGGETTWQIIDAFFLPVASGGPYPGNTVNIEDLCLPIAFGQCFNLFIYDSYGDGMCCAYGMGSWELQTTSGRTMLYDLFEDPASGFGPPGDVSPAVPPASPGYNNGHPFCLPAGVTAILGDECEVYTNNLLSKVYTSQVPGASLYQFDFSDPDNGYARRIAVPNNWVRFSQMQSPPLTAGVVYFCRARADQGAPGFLDDHFGTGCQLGLDPNQVPGCTELIAMGDPAYAPNTWSCGATRAFGGGDKIWAYPVVNGTQYRFQFENIGEGYLRNVLRPSYVCLLNWSTLPLNNGSQYTVRVEVQVNNTWSGFCGADCTLNILNPPVGGGGNQNAAPAMDGSGVQLWPNPVRDGRVHLLMEGLTDEQQRITVEVFDTYGKRVLAREFDNSGEVFNTVLDLGGDMAAGMYQVHLNVNGKDHMERLAIQ